VTIVDIVSPGVDQVVRCAGYREADVQPSPALAAITSKEPTMVKGLLVAGLAGLVGLGAPPPTPAQAAPPLKATFRCPGSSTCAGQPDAIQSDGRVEGQPPVSFDGYRTWSVKKTTYMYGAFLNGVGGIDIN